MYYPQVSRICVMTGICPYHLNAVTSINLLLLLVHIPGIFCTHPERCTKKAKVTRGNEMLRLY